MLESLSMVYKAAGGQFVEHEHEDENVDPKQQSSISHITKENPQLLHLDLIDFTLSHDYHPQWGAIFGELPNLLQLRIAGSHLNINSLSSPCNLDSPSLVHDGALYHFQRLLTYLVVEKGLPPESGTVRNIAVARSSEGMGLGTKLRNVVV
ncbi:hypothetical protein FRB96_009125 [Tulasnella sp. 330]|nr:hypothetical protein FRB96_009125 [Tulasnella sp. 330]KAG8875938.1 hypothetical protein FRB97_004615 [Tulasnella sp. 331]